MKTLSSDGEGIEEHKMVDKRFVIETKADEAYQTAQRVGLQSTGTHLGGREVVMSAQRASDVIIRAALHIDAQIFGRYGRIPHGNRTELRRVFDLKVCEHRHGHSDVCVCVCVGFF